MRYIFRSESTGILVQMTSFVVRYDVIYHSFPINSQYLMTCGVDSPDFPISGVGRSGDIVCEENYMLLQY